MKTPKEVSRAMIILCMLIIVLSGVLMSWDVVAILFSDALYIALASSTTRNFVMSFKIISRDGSC